MKTPYILAQILLGGLQPSFLPLSHRKGKLQTCEFQLSYIHTQRQIVYLEILKLDFITQK